MINEARQSSGKMLFGEAGAAKAHKSSAANAPHFGRVPAAAELNALARTPDAFSGEVTVAQPFDASIVGPR